MDMRIVLVFVFMVLLVGISMTKHIIPFLDYTLNLNPLSFQLLGRSNEESIISYLKYITFREKLELMIPFLEAADVPTMFLGAGYRKQHGHKHVHEGMEHLQCH